MRVRARVCVCVCVCVCARMYLDVSLSLPVVVQVVRMRLQTQAMHVDEGIVMYRCVTLGEVIVSGYSGCVVRSSCDGLPCAAGARGMLCGRSSVWRECQRCGRVWARRC